jgi:hypothetical protein
MSFDNLDTDDVSSDIEEEGGTPEEASNRTFLIVAGVFGAIVVLSLICLVLFVVFKVIPGRNTQSQKATQAVLNNAGTLEAALKTDAARKFTPTSTQTYTPVPVTATTKPSNTPVVKPSSTPTPPNAATMEYLYKMATAAAETKAALGKASPTFTPNATSLGNTGFADQVGAPALLGLAAVLVVVIFLARRLRAANS